MTLQEKIDRLPLNIEHEGILFKLKIEISHCGVILRYRYYSDLFAVKEYSEDRSISKLFEDVVDQALTIIENKEWVVKISEIKINEGILNYINNHKPPFEFIPKLGSLWKVEREISYPNVNGGYPVIELSNSKGEWLRLPKCIIDNE